MNPKEKLNELVVGFTDLFWDDDLHTDCNFPCPAPEHQGSKRARMWLDGGRVRLKCPVGCAPDNILAAVRPLTPNGNGAPSPSNGAPPRTLPARAIAPLAAAERHGAPSDRDYIIAPPAAEAMPAKRGHVLTADDKTDFIVAHWKSQLIRKIGEVDARYRPTDAAGLAEALMQFAFGPDAPREVKRPPELTLADEEVAGIFADLASRAWGERTLLSASPANGAVVASAARRAPGLRTVRDYMAEMKSRQERKALIQGLFYEGETVLMVGRAMAGKSTAAGEMVRCFVTNDDFLGRAVRKTRVGYLALERNGHAVARQFSEWGISDDVLFTDEVPPMQPAALAEFLERQITEHHLGVLFVDHLQNLVRVADSNDYAVVSNALEPFAAVARRTGCALILLHHLPKSPREDGEIDAMGSEAYRGAADCFIESTRSNGRYFIRAEARGGGLLPRMVLTLDRETGIVSGTNALDEERVELEGRILEHLKAAGEPVPGPELREALGTRSKILFEALENLVETKRVDRSGEGKKNHPHIYQISTFRHFPSTGNANDESAGDGRTIGADDGREDSSIHHFPSVGKANDESENAQSALRPQAKMLFPGSGNGIAKNGAAKDSFQPLAGTANDANDANDESVKMGRATMAPDADEEVEL